MAYGILSAKKLLGNCLAKHTHFGSSLHILQHKKFTLRNRPVLNSLIIKVGPEYRGPPILVLENYLGGRTHYRSYHLNSRAFSQDCLRIISCQRCNRAIASPNPSFSDTPRKNNEQICPETTDCLFNGNLCPTSHIHQSNNRTDTNDHSQDGE